MFQGSWVFFFFLSLMSHQTIPNILIGTLESTNSNFRAVGGLTRGIPSCYKDTHLQMVLDHGEYIINNNTNWSLSRYHLYPNSENWRLLFYVIMVWNRVYGMVWRYEMVWYRIYCMVFVTLWYGIYGKWYGVNYIASWYMVRRWSRYGIALWDRTVLVSRYCFAVFL